MNAAPTCLPSCPTAPAARRTSAVRPNPFKGSANPFKAFAHPFKGFGHPLMGLAHPFKGFGHPLMGLIHPFKGFGLFPVSFSPHPQVFPTFHPH